MTNDPPPPGPRGGAGAFLRSRIRVLALIWGAALAIIAAMYWLFSDLLTQPDLFTTPALLVLAAAAYGTWHVARPRHEHGDRRHGDRRHASRREDEEE